MKIKLLQIKSIPAVGGLIRQLDRDIQKFGFIRALREILARFHVDWKVHYENQETEIAFKSHGCVVIFNHPYEIETYLIMASLPKIRNDLKIIATANLLGFSKQIDAYIFPVCVDHHASREKAGKLSGKIAKLLNCRPQIDPIQAHLKNLNTLKRAANFVSHGGIVTICPEGFRGIGGKWFSGIGHLLTQIQIQKPTYLIFAYIKGTSIFDWFRLLPVINRLFPRLTIIFSKPIKISSLLNKNPNPKHLKETLEQTYKKWSKSFY